MSQRLESVLLRTARAEDIASWVGPLEREANAVPWSEHLLSGELNSPYSVFWVAESPQRPLGFVIVHMAGDEAEILEIAVSPETRRLGVGRKLMQRAAATAGERGCEALFLEVRESNFAARNLYEGLGFKPIGLRKRYYRDNGEDAIVMRLDLITTK